MTLQNHHNPISQQGWSSLIILLMVILLSSATKNNHYIEYIEKYAPMAQEQQQTYGIPASITLAQGLLESAAGRSTLARIGNNHFGIKCHKDWKGDTMLRDDDEANECFRVYQSALQSFEDHSRFLKRKRYAPLFELDPGDYAGWARTLRQCGYATDPNYADRLITIIELYALYAYDESDNTASAEETAEFIRSTLINSHVVRRSRGLHFIIAVPGDTYKSVAKEFNTDPRRLALINDSETTDSPIKPWEEIYLEQKHETAPEGMNSITIGTDETLHSVAQRLGMTLSSIKKLNPRAKDTPGTRLRLRP